MTAQLSSSTVDRASGSHSLNEEYKSLPTSCIHSCKSVLDLRKQNTITHLPRVILIGGVALEDFGLLTLFYFYFLLGYGRSGWGRFES